MQKYFPVVPTEEQHSVTTLELFFDLVFVFALTQITAMVAADTSVTGFLQGFVMLALLWWGWVSYSWLGNQAKADEGALRAGLVIATGATFVCGLAIPHAFNAPGHGHIEPWLFAASYTLVRATHLAVYRIAAGDDEGLRRQLMLASIPIAIACLLLIVGAFLEPEWQLVLWIVSLLIDYGGIWLEGAEGWRVPSPKHFAERYGLIIIVALGESIVSIGVGIGAYELRPSVVVAALLALLISICLWWLYFDVIASFAERLLARLQAQDRARLAQDSYSYLHFPMLLGIVILALGQKIAMGSIADYHTGRGPWMPLSFVAVVSLCLGPAVYLVAHLAFRFRNIGTVNKPRLLVSILLILLIPVCAILPALISLGIVGLVLGLLVTYEFWHYADARQKLRHGDAQATEAQAEESSEIGVTEFL